MGVLSDRQAALIAARTSTVAQIKSAMDLAYRKLTGWSPEQEKFLLDMEALQKETVATHISLPEYFAIRQRYAEEMEESMQAARTMKADWNHLPITYPVARVPRGYVWCDVLKNEYVCWDGSKWLRYPKSRLNDHLYPRTDPGGDDRAP